MTVHGDSRTTLERLISKAKKRADASLRRSPQVINTFQKWKTKKKKYSPEALVRIKAFEDKHGITRQPKLRGAKSRKKPTLPKFNLPPP